MSTGSDSGRGNVSEALPNPLGGYPICRAVGTVIPPAPAGPFGIVWGSGAFKTKNPASGVAYMVGRKQADPKRFGLHVRLGEALACFPSGEHLTNESRNRSTTAIGERLASPNAGPEGEAQD